MTSITNPDKTDVLLVDGHHLFREGLRLLIDSHPGFTTVGDCGTLGDAALMIEQTAPVVTLFDLHYVDGNGIDKIPIFAERTKVVVLTGDNEPAIHERCLKSGASGLVSKATGSKVLFEALQTVVSGEIWFDTGLMGKVVRDLTRPQGNGPLDAEAEKIKNLSPREREVIMLVGEGLKNRSIAERMFISETTVRHHMTSILSKLELSSRLELVVFAFRHGLVQIPQRVTR